MLSDEQLDQIYEKAWDAHEPECGCHAAGLRAVAEAAVKDAVGGRDRESDRHRFPDPAFNRWLDESITENGEFSVWHLLGDITPAWAAWESRPQYERKACDLCDCTGDIHDQTGEWRGECPYCRPQASAAVPEGVLSIARRMVEESKENDHCTAHPVFIVQKRRIVTGIDTEYTDNIAWVSEGEILDAEESSALEAAYQDTGQVPDDYTRTGCCEEWEHIDTYLTERAALSRCSGAPDYRVTVESAYRNKEMQIVRAFLMSLAASQPEVSE